MNESKIVYHYCSLDSFMKIIKTGEIWLTDVTKSNDSKELKYAYEKIIDEFDRRIEKYKKSGDDITPLVNCRKLLDDFKINNMLFHVCCFSTERDLLSQWSMYADNGTGIAIGFKADELNNLKNSKDNFQNIDFGKMNYSLRKFTDDINNKINEILDKYKGEKNHANAYFDFLNYIITDIMKNVYFYKHSSFKQEHEYRLVYNSKPYTYINESDTSKIIRQRFKSQIEALTSHAKLGEVDFYLSKGKLVSYRPLYIKNLQTFSGLITEVVIGPKSAVTDEDIHLLLIANGIDPSKIKITYSKLSYQ